MLIKFMRCLPISGKENAFSKAQEFWRDSATCAGFIGQFGGWDTLSSHALILAFWQNQESIDLFMDEVHDRIANMNQQHLTYEYCAVDYLNIQMSIADMTTSDLSKTGYVRIANCLLYPNGRENFFADQTSVWNPGMSSCPGMLGGYIGQFNQEANRYLVVSFWENAQSHSDYVNNMFPKLKSKVNIEHYIKDLSGHQFLINKKWNVFPTM